MLYGALNGNEFIHTYAYTVDTVLPCFIIQFSIILPVRMVNIIGVLKF